jgi:hypothetical protein
MMLVLFAVAALIGFAYVVRWERRHFIGRGLVRSWLWVRLTSIPAALLVLAMAAIPARSTSGMEGLAVFYLLLIIAAPPLWFAIHWVVGRATKPQLAFGDTARIAVSPILYAMVLAAVAPALQSFAWAVLRALDAK